jgi:predicted membrane protein
MLTRSPVIVSRFGAMNSGVFETKKFHQTCRNPSKIELDVQLYLCSLKIIKSEHYRKCFSLAMLMFQLFVLITSRHSTETHLRCFNCALFNILFLLNIFAKVCAVFCVTVICATIYLMSTTALHYSTTLYD